MLTPIDKRIIKELQRDLPLTLSPFLEISQRIDISEEELLKRIKELQKRGYLHRFGAVVRHERLGFKANCITVWKVPQEDIKKVGRIIASFNQVSHCYQRKGWDYNLFTMIHGKSRGECRKVIKEISEEIGIKEGEILFTTKEFKKVSMEYF